MGRDTVYAEQGSAVVQLRLVAQDAAAGTRRWIVRWSLFHERIEWRFDVLSDRETDVVVEREMLSQWD